MKKNHQKDASHLKNKKNLHMAKDARKALKKGENKNRKAQEEFNNVTTTIFFTFIFCIWKRIYFA